MATVKTYLFDLVQFIATSDPHHFQYHLTEAS